MLRVLEAKKVHVIDETSGDKGKAMLGQGSKLPSCRQYALDHRSTYSKVPWELCTWQARITIDLIHNSQNKNVPNPTMLHSEQKCACFCSEWSIGGYGIGAFWDLLNWSIPQQYRTKQYSCKIPGAPFTNMVPKSHLLGWYRNFLVYWFLKLDNQVVNSTRLKDKFGWIWRADNP